MGCWSENCALSGLEIHYGADMYVGTLIPYPQYSGWQWQFAVPPIRGTYDDYGGVDLTESNLMFKLREGENWRPRDNGWGESRADDDEEDDPAGVSERVEPQPVYFHAGAVEALWDLPPDFPYFYTEDDFGKVTSHEVETLGDMMRGGTAGQLRKIRAMIEADAAADANETPDQKMMRYVGRSFGRSVFGSSSRDLLQANIRDVCNDMIERQPTTFDFESMLKFYERCRLIVGGAMELRRSITPGIQGPQHGGQQALVYFNNKITEIAKERLRETDYDGDVDE